MPKLNKEMDQITRGAKRKKKTKKKREKAGVKDLRNAIVKLYNTSA